jgi:serine/threonine-protein kinase
LQAAGYHIDEEQVPDAAAQGVVIAQVPAAGSELSPGKTVTITISSGPAPSTTTTESRPVSVPNVIGLRLQKAIAMLGQAGLSANATETTPPEQASQAGTVASQNPAGGSAVPLGTVVSLTVYSQ